MALMTLMANGCSLLHNKPAPSLQIRFSPSSSSSSSLAVPASTFGGRQQARRPVVVVSLQATPTAAAAQLTRESFPKDFIFGSGVSAFQVEGYPTEGGRGHTIWDSFVHIPGNILDGTVNYPSCEFYTRFEEDMEIMKSLGFNAFRFSISWTRIYPHGDHRESLEGIQFYNNVINSCVRAGLTPVVTLFHWETPQYLENDPDILGWRTKNIIPRFVELAETCFRHFGDRVKKWVTINEMLIFTSRGYATGTLAPGRCSVPRADGTICAAGDSSSEPYLVGHHLLLAHARVYHVYNTKFKKHQQGLVGWNPVHFGAKPFSTKQEDVNATQRYLEFRAGWQIDPLVFGDYPKSMRDIIGERLPSFTEEEKKELKGTLDFLSHNYYTAYYIKQIPPPKDPWFNNDGNFEETVTNFEGNYIGPQMGPKDSWIYSVPDGLTNILKWMKDRYNNIPSYIAENGVMDISTTLSEALNDTQRIEYTKEHLAAILEAKNKHNVDMRGYFHWSYIDNFEWRSGYASRYGLVRCEFEQGKPPIRTLKSSAKWFQSFLGVGSNK